MHKIIASIQVFIRSMSLVLMSSMLFGKTMTMIGLNVILLINEALFKLTQFFEVIPINYLGLLMLFHFYHSAT